MLAYFLVHYVLCAVWMQFEDVIKIATFAGNRGQIKYHKHNDDLMAQQLWHHSLVATELSCRHSVLHFIKFPGLCILPTIWVFPNSTTSSAGV